MRKASEINMLVACEESQAVTIEFRKLGFNAYSCDLQECSGGHPEWHIQDDVVKVMNNDWDVMIAFPPCTDLAVSGAAHFERKRKDGSQQKSIEFFMLFADSKIHHTSIENPVGIMSSLYRKPDQVIHPYYFGDEAQKTTCLWLKNLPRLYHNPKPNLFDSNITWVDKGEMMVCVRKDGRIEQRAKHNQGLSPSPERGKLRSKTFPGIAKAMAEQWGEYLLNQN